MNRRLLIAIPLLCVGFSQPSVSGSTLTFEQRVQAQRVLELLRYRHQLGTKQPFEAAVPRSVIEKKVQTSLEESVALEEYWWTPITEDALRQELNRIEASTLDPARLREVYAAFDHDPQLVLEMLSRASLVERLTRNFYAFDERIHVVKRREAEELVAGLRSGAIDPRQEDPRRSVVELNPEGAPDASLDAKRRWSPTASSADAQNSQHAGHSGLRAGGGEVAGSNRSLVEKRDAFVVQTVLPEESGSSKLVTYTLPKRPWESWWNEMENRFPAARARTVVQPRSSPQMRDEDRLYARIQAGSPLATCRPDDTWDTTPFDSIPGSLAGHKAVWTGTEMIVWADKRLGGFRYNPRTDTWRSMSTLGAPEPDPDPLAVTPWLEEPTTTALWTGREMIVWDGFNVRGGRYDPDTDTWRPMATAGAPSWRTHYSSIWTGTEMIVWGGGGPDGVLNTGARYDTVSDSWRPMSRLGAPAPRAGAAVLWTGDRMIVWGGWPSPQADDGAFYDPVTDLWSAMSTTGAFPGGFWPSAVWADDQMFVMRNTCDPRSRRYDRETDTWSAFSYLDPVWGCVDSTSRVWTGSKLIFWDAENSRGASYDPASDRWSFMSNTNAPSQRHIPSAVWTGELMIVWGGDAGSSGGRYDPETDSWTPTATSAGPEERLHHATLWTGNEMIVWGGVSGIFRTITGGARFDVLTGQWRTLPTMGAPAWAGGSILWTGSEMIAWEGIDSGGGRYDPFADSWRSMSTADAPAQEAGFNMAWTGSEAVLWGGYFDPHHIPDDPLPEYPRDGGIYNPATDSWRPTSTTGAPPGRLGPATVWTGEDLIVWGGDYCYGGYCEGNRGGGRYNPVTDTWKPMNFMGGSVAAAIWTGREMFLLHPYWHDMLKYDPADDSWSPANSPDFLWDRPVVWTGEEIIMAGGFTGGRFSPATGEWTRLSSTGTPLPRGGSTAVWTGNAMIVWGGMVSAPEDTATRTGGVYYLGVDLDDDGFTACQGDCNDANAAIRPTGLELPGNLFDENCDGVLSCPPPVTGGHARQFLRCVAAECRRLAGNGVIDDRECIGGIRKTPAPMRCGDGRRNRQEACDGSDLGGASCETLGLDGGTLACNASCDEYDLSGCESVCGDSIVSGLEACDGDNTSEESCSSQGFDSGTLSCTGSCRNLDTSSCSAVCGDGAARGHEVCDGDDFRGETCVGFGFDGGALSCTESCGRIDLSGCTTVCGDGARRGFELCDGEDLAGMSCRYRGYQRGALGCNQTCDGFDVSQCVTGQ